MSRHVLAPLRPTMHREVIVGWDRPLRTFFVQAIWTSGAVHRWHGGRLGEIPTALEAIGVASAYAAITPELLGTLQQDLEHESGPDGPAQAALKEMLQ